jgi:putative ABC transport system permease protein
MKAMFLKINRIYWIMGVIILFAIVGLAAWNMNGVTTHLSNQFLLATSFSAVIGIFFDIYPANRAASLQPVEALRSE